MLRLWMALAAVAMLLGFAPAGKAAASLEGKWHFVLDTSGGDRESDAEFHLDGDQVTGKFGASDVKGTFKEGKLNLSFPFSSDEAGDGTLKFDGDLTDAGLSGKWAFEEYNGTFKATRKE